MEGRLLACVVVSCFFECAFLCAGSISGEREFLHCLTSLRRPPTVYGHWNSTAYTSVLQSSIFNLRFMPTPVSERPALIITPAEESQVPTVVSCARRHDLLLKIRSGGHDLEGISYVSQEPFILLDLRNLRGVAVDVKSKTAWIQAGATLGEVYYAVAAKSGTLGFPGGLCPTVGAGGHISGGGYGMMIRMYGMAADQVIDARIVTAAGGAIDDRKSMGEDLFWAMRGGGGSSFGVVLAWRVRLVDVPPTVTVFTVNRNIMQNNTGLVHRWQYVASTLPNELTIDVNLKVVDDGRKGRTVQAAFFSLFLGNADQLLKIMAYSFHELGLARKDCTEMRWIESVLYFRELPLSPLEQMLQRTPPTDQSFFKGKIDYVTKPISIETILAVWEKLYQVESEVGQINLVPYGGRMAEISDSAIPFPNRAGKLYQVFYFVTWGGMNITIAASDDTSAAAVTARRIQWVRSLYTYMTPNVPNSPRSAYVNYRDLDLGINDRGRTTSYRTAARWGRPYFAGNFDRLVRIKTKVDPRNFFRNQQSIPSLSSSP